MYLYTQIILCICICTVICSYVLPYILIGKKFSSGASVSDLPTGGKEVVIQGDVYFDVPALLINEFKVFLVVYIYVVLLLWYTYAYAYCEICAYSYVYMCIG